MERATERSHFGAEPALEPETRELGRISAYGRSERGVHVIPQREAIERIAKATKERGSAAPDDSSFFVWLDIAGPGETEVELLRDQLGFHPLAVEDCVKGRQRPKLERYPGHFFLVIYGARINAERDQVLFHELHIFIGNGFIVTVHDHRIEEVRETIGLWRSRPARFGNVGAVAHALLDDLVDDYFPVIDYFADKVSACEAALLEDRHEDAVKSFHDIRRQLILFRRVVAPEREIIATLVRRDLPFLSPDLIPYLQDVRDHTMRIAEEIDTLRDLIGTALEGHASAAAHELNQTVRRMTAWSIVLMSMNLIASNYGMNFHFMPELNEAWGYPVAVGAMLFVGAVLLVLFRRLRWL